MIDSKRALVVCLAVSLVACFGKSKLPPGIQPKGPPGASVTAFARGLDHPRWIYVLPNGDVLVAETNAPPRPDDGKSRSSTHPSGWRLSATS